MYDASLSLNTVVSNPPLSEKIMKSEMNMKSNFFRKCFCLPVVILCLDFTIFPVHVARLYTRAVGNVKVTVPFVPMRPDPTGGSRIAQVLRGGIEYGASKTKRAPVRRKNGVLPSLMHVCPALFIFFGLVQALDLKWASVSLPGLVFLLFAGKYVGFLLFAGEYGAPRVPVCSPCCSALAGVRRSARFNIFLKH